MDTLSISTRRRMVKNAFKKYHAGKYNYHILKENNEFGFGKRKGSEVVILENDSCGTFAFQNNNYSRSESNWSCRYLIFYNNPLKKISDSIGLTNESLYFLGVSYSKIGDTRRFYSEHEFLPVWYSFTQLFENHMIPLVSLMKNPRDHYEYLKHIGSFNISSSAMIFIILTKIFEPEKLDTVMKIWEPMLEDLLSKYRASVEEDLDLYMPIVEKVTREYIEEQNILSSEDYVKTGTSQQMRDHIFFIYKGRETQGEHPEDYYHRVNKEFPRYFSD